jgi:hypothetical protein
LKEKWGTIMKALLSVFICIIYSNAFAGACFEAYKEAKRLEKVVSGVYHTSETDDEWTGFASWEKVKDLTDSEIKRVLNLENDPEFDEEELLFRVESYTEAYRFMRNELENLEFYAENKPNDDSPAKFKRLIHEISKKYGANIRLVLNGGGDGDSIFIGDHIIVVIMPNGCLFGLKVLTVWT